MKMLFDERGVLVGTDYYRSAECAAGVPCCAVRDGTWHLLLPEACPVIHGNTRFAWALPVVAKEQKAGWAWRLIMRKGWTVLLPLPAFIHPVPDLPGYGDEYRAALVIYGRWLPGLAVRALGDFNIEDEAPEVVYSSSLTVRRLRIEEVLRLGGKPEATYK